VIINAGVIIGSTSTANPAFDVGDWPVGFGITMQINGRIQGKGGDGGVGLESGENGPGQAGGTALFTRSNIDVEYGTDAEVWGGGGGGGSGNAFGAMSGGGGGGAGTLPGSGGAGLGVSSAGQPGTTEAGGAGGPDNEGDANADGGAGGGPGLAGSAGSRTHPFIPGGSGGAAGPAIDGDSFVTVTSGSADVRGPTIN
jgi:hypothetical protein